MTLRLSSAALALVLLAGPAAGQTPAAGTAPATNEAEDTDAPSQQGTDGGPTTEMSDLDDITLLETLLTDAEWPDALFAPGFLAALPAPDLRAILAQLRDTIGGPVTVEGEAGQFLARTPTHSVPLTLTRDGEGRISGLFFSPPDATDRTVPDILAEMATLAPEVSWLITRGDTVLDARDPDAPLAVGSAFKLGVLKALQDAIEAGDIGWNDVYLLAERHKSLPSGLLQNFPLDSPLTVNTLAALMISQSDNTATDFLMEIVGRDAVGAALDLDVPPPTTREVFVLKANPTLRAVLRTMDTQDEAAWRDLYDRIAEAPLPGAGAVATPHTQGAEWYVSLETLCGLAAEVARNDVFAINPGPIAPGRWSRVAYKGGSEIGVLNLTAHLEAPDGETYCLAVTLNGPDALNEQAAIALFGALAARLPDFEPDDA